MHVACGRGSLVLWRRCDTLCTSGFMDNVMFLYRGANGPESTTTLFGRVRQLALPVGRQTTAICDCVAGECELFTSHVYVLVCRLGNGLTQKLAVFLSATLIVSYNTPILNVFTQSNNRSILLYLRPR